MNPNHTSYFSSPAPTFIQWIDAVKTYLSRSDIDLFSRADVCDSVLDTIACLYTDGATDVSTDAAIASMMELTSKHIQHFMQDYGHIKVGLVLDNLDFFRDTVLKGSRFVLTTAESRGVFKKAITLDRPYLKIYKDGTTGDIAVKYK